MEAHLPSSVLLRGARHRDLKLEETHHILSLSTTCRSSVPLCNHMPGSVSTVSGNRGRAGCEGLAGLTVVGSRISS